MCNFNKAWIGKCPNPNVEGQSFCSEHHGVRCTSCGEQATRECSETMGGLVCCAPLCAECQHTIYPGGCNQLEESLPEGITLRAHRKASAQLFKPWYTYIMPGKAARENAEVLRTLKPGVY